MNQSDYVIEEFYIITWRISLLSHQFFYYFLLGKEEREGRGIMALDEGVYNIPYSGKFPRGNIFMV